MSNDNCDRWHFQTHVRVHHGLTALKEVRDRVLGEQEIACEVHLQRQWGTCSRAEIQMEGNTIPFQILNL